MEGLSIRVRNPFTLRESLLVALEVAWPDLPPDRVTCLRAFIAGIPALIHPTEVVVDAAQREGLLACTAYFRPSRTSHWFREDLGQALVDLERDLK